MQPAEKPTPTRSVSFDLMLRFLAICYEELSTVTSFIGERLVAGQFPFEALKVAYSPADSDRPLADRMN